VVVRIPELASDVGVLTSRPSRVRGGRGGLLVN
jgi:hypothetical protein